MSQKGQGDKPPVPPPPRRPRTSAPPAATPGDVTPASASPPGPAARRISRGVEPDPPATSSRVSRPISPPLGGPVVPGAKTPPPRLTIRDIGTGTPAPGKAVPASGPSSSPEKSAKASGPGPTPKASFRDAGTSTPGGKTTVVPSRVSARDAGPSTSARASIPGSGLSTSNRDSVPATVPRVTIRASSLDSRPRETLSVGESRSSPRISLPPSPTKKTPSPSSRIKFQEAGPSTSAKSVKLAATKTADSGDPAPKSRFNIFKKKPARRGSATTVPTAATAPTAPTAPQNRVKTNRILYSSDEEVREALVEFSVFIIFLILTSLVTLSVRHSYMFYFNDTMKKLFTTRELVIAPSVTVCFEKLITVPDWWDYLIYNFLITLHGDLSFLEGDLGPTNYTPPIVVPVVEKPDDSDDVPAAVPPPAVGKPNDNKDVPAAVPPPAVGKPDDNKNVPAAVPPPAVGKPNDNKDVPANAPQPQKGNVVEKSPKADMELNKLLEKSPYNWDPSVDWVPGERMVRQANANENTEPPASGNEDPGESNVTTAHLEGRVFLYENLLLGPPRLRQIRVRKESCYVNDAFIRYFNTCYAAYSAAAEDRKAKYKGTPYRTMKDLDTTPLWTVLAFYRSGGYVVDLTFDKDKNLALITELKDKHWLDRGSRLCLVEFNLFNENTDIFQSVKLIAEIPPTGGVIPQAHLQTVKQYSFFTDRSMVMTVIYIFWYIMIVYYTIYEINEIRKSGCKNYFFSMLNILDCIILLLCYLALIYNVWHTFKVRSVTNKAIEELSYQSLDVLCFWNIIYVDMMAILAFLVWIKIFKFISFNKTLVQFTTTLKRCSKDLAGFSLMFGIVFLAYAQLGLLLFGTKHPDFRNFITSILTMIRMILGDFQYNLIEQANRVLGPIYFLTYILLVFFILLNMFLAIIMETYNTVKSEITQGRSHLGSYIYKKLTGLLYLITHCGRKRRPRPEITAREVEDAEQEKAAQEEPEEMRKNLTPAEAKYFEEIPPGGNKEFVRLSNRVGLLEEILEKLITNMDDILKRVERERSHKKK